MLYNEASRIVSTSEDVLSGNTPEAQPKGHMDVREKWEADDLFDSTFVLPSNCEWWQHMADLSLEESHSDSDVMDLYAGDYSNYSSLRDDVDTADDVNEERAVPERVYHLDTRWTTIWGLDIIWEDENEKYI